MSAPVLSWSFVEQRKPEGIPCPAALTMHESTIHPKASSSFCLARASEQGSLHPTLRANPFPEVTGLFCRLPLPTLLYWPEAANLGDLMRLWVRAGVRINLSFGFSRSVEGAPCTSKDKMLYLLFNLISIQLDFKVKRSVKKKRQRFPRPPPASPDFLTLPYTIHFPGGEY